MANQIACGNRKAHADILAVEELGLRQVHHLDVAEVRACFEAGAHGIESLEEADLRRDAWADSYEADPDAAYERHLENAGWADYELERQMDAQRGVVSFEDAWDASDRAQGIVTRPSKMA